MMSKAAGSIKSQLLLATVAAGLIPVVLLAITSRSLIADAIEDYIFQKYDDLNQDLSRQVKLVMKTAASDLRALRTNPIILDANSSMEDREAEMQRLVSVYGMFDDISLYNPNGEMIMSTNPVPPEALDYSRWFSDAVNGDTRISTPQPAVGKPDELFLSVYFPIGREVGASDNKYYIVRARLPFTAVWDVIDGFSTRDGGEALLVDKFGNIIAHRDKKLIYTKFDGRVTGDAMSWSGQGEREAGSGEKYFYVGSELGSVDTQVGQSWYVITQAPRAIITNLVVRSNLYHLFAGIIALAIALLIGKLIVGPIARAMIEASVVAKKFAGGKFEARITEQGSREFSLLAKTFNEMAEELGRRRQAMQEELKVGGEKLKDSEKELDVASAQIRAAFESTREAVLIIRNDGVVIAANDRLRTFFNLPGRELVWGDFAGFEKAFFACFEDPALMKAHWKDLQRNVKESRDAEWTVVSPKPLSITSYAAPVRDGNGEVIARLWMFEDLTKQKELQKGLEQAQKMEAIGRLAGGVAHDFNNLLTGIIGNLSLAQMRGGSALEKNEGAPYIHTARTAAERAASLVKQLLGFSRRNHLTLQACNVNDILTEVCDLLVHTFDPRVEIVMKKSSDLWSAKVDPAQVQQVVMNLCVNARDVMPEGGKLTLSTKNVEVGISDAARHDAIPGEYVRLTVSDSGQGIPKDLIDKIFEPFFTTKEPGKGTGLGLATSYGIVQQHGGWIDCRSELGSGAKFSIFLPKGEKAAEERQRLALRSKKGNGSVSTSGETILLIDDERVVRTVAESVLGHAGFKTLSASDGVEGVEMVRSHGDQIALVLLDLTMPRMSGSDTLRVIRQVRPELPVVICSGYLLDLDDFANEVGIRPDGLIQKPYKVSELPLVVRQIIDERTGAAPELDISGRGETVDHDDELALGS